MSVYSAKSSVVRFIDEDVWHGRRSLDLSPHLVEVPNAPEINLDLLGRLLEHALGLGLDKEADLDQWLAPRFHSALRIPARLAGDPGFWTWLCFAVGMPYIRHRWPHTLYRIVGDFKRNALSRLWFFSEMARNGSDYSDVRRVLRNASTAQYAMENRYAMYRPAVIAFGRVAEEEALGSKAMLQLSKRINAYLSLRSLEATGYMPPDETRDEEWWHDEPTFKELIEHEPSGPSDHQVPSTAIDDLVRWYSSLLVDLNERKTA